MKKFLIFLNVIVFSISVTGQVDPKQITIVRDSLGVPHIFGKTDADAAYGLAWAHAEDDFKDIQYVFLTGKGMLGRAIGKEGAKADYAAALLRCRQNAEEHEKDISPVFRKILEGYVQGINDYAGQHPEEVLVRQAFPATVTDYLAAAGFSLCIISGADKTLGDILGGKIATLPGYAGSGGSNAFAIHPSKTTTGEAFLAINSHQPLEGPVAWYEAHVQSEEGWNIIGGLFPGGACIFAGVNENLGWAHTVNFMDKIDVYQLEMDASGKQYKYDGRWLPLEQAKVRLRVKGIPIAISKKIYWSVYGATVKTDRGTFSMRLTANQGVQSLEQWWRMNKAKNFTQFKEALRMQALPMMNIVYADRYDTIFYVSGGRMPLRKDSTRLDWSGTLPGNTSATFWDQYHAFEELPQVMNPTSGYVYNTNHSPFLATADGFNIDPKKYDRTSGYETYHNNRSLRFAQMIGTKEKLDFAAFRAMKFDRQLPWPLQYPVQLDSLWVLDSAYFKPYGQIQETLQRWDRVADQQSTGAAAFLLLYHYVNEKRGVIGNRIDRFEWMEIFRHIHDYQLRYFGRTGITLGELQRHSRGGVDLPAWGLPDVLMAMHSKQQPDGRFRVMAGESLIQLVRFPKEGLPIIESVNCYGASSKPGSEHYTDQMQMYLEGRTRRVSLDRGEVMRSAMKVYRPGE